MRIVREPGDAILVPVADAEIVASPGEMAFVDAPEIDTGNATQMPPPPPRAARARACTSSRAVPARELHRRAGADRRRVVEVVPPEPPKLLEMARAVVDVDEDLPPLELDFRADRPARAGRGAPRRPLPVSLPLRAASSSTARACDFLDAGARRRRPAPLVGCERSRQIHAALYGHEPARARRLLPRRASRQRRTRRRCSSAAWARARGVSWQTRRDGRPCPGERASKRSARRCTRWPPHDRGRPRRLGDLRPPVGHGRDARAVRRPRPHAALVRIIAALAAVQAELGIIPAAAADEIAAASASPTSSPSARRPAAAATPRSA